MLFWWTRIPDDCSKEVADLMLKQAVRPPLCRLTLAQAMGEIGSGFGRWGSTVIGIAGKEEFIAPMYTGIQVSWNDRFLGGLLPLCLEVHPCFGKEEFEGLRFNWLIWNRLRESPDVHFMRATYKGEMLWMLVTEMSMGGLVDLFRIAYSRELVRELRAFHLELHDPLAS